MIYNNLTVTINENGFITTALWLIIGVVFAAMYIFILKTLRGKFVRLLIESEIFDEESAVTLKELGIKDNFFNRAILKTNSSFVSDFIVIPDKETKYYIPPQNIEKVQAKYRDNGITFIQLLLTILAFLVVTYILASLVPSLLNWL